MLMRTALLATLALAAVSTVTFAQDDSPLMTLLARPPAPVPEPLVIDSRTLTLAGAALAAERLTDDILVLIRIVTLQQNLLATNATRVASGAQPLAIPRRICTASPLATMCGVLPYTFATAPGDQP